MGLVVLKVVLRSGFVQELAYDRTEPLQRTYDLLRQHQADASVSQVLLTDEYGHSLSVLAGDVVGFAVADLEAENRLALNVSLLRQRVQEEFTKRVQDEQARRGRLLVPGTMAMPVAAGTANGASVIR